MHRTLLFLQEFELAFADDSFEVSLIQNHLLRKDEAFERERRHILLRHQLARRLKKVQNFTGLIRIRTCSRLKFDNNVFREFQIQN